LLKKKYRVTYHTWSGRGVDIEMFKRLIKFGFPNGVQFFLDMLGFTLFILLVGRYGKVELAATNIAFNINSLAFLPMIGMGIAVSVVVGQRLGENEPEKAEYSVWSALHLGMIYMTLISICYLAFPGLFLRPFGYGDEESFEAIYEYGVVLLRFVALYSVFDSLIIVFSSAIKGAGDTKFVMWAIVLLSWSLMVIPTYLAVSVFKWTLFSAWGFATNYILILGVVFYLRFRGGAWKTMRVIEERRVPTV
jgi:MATE family multidrug resistance protein